MQQYGRHKHDYKVTKCSFIRQKYLNSAIIRKKYDELSVGKKLVVVIVPKLIL